MVMDLRNRTEDEKELILICPVHRLLCAGCQFSARIPKVWLSEKLQKEVKNIKGRIRG
jgi:hypothetical protein